MARPIKNADEKLTETIRFRATTATRESLKDKSFAAGISEADFMRLLLDDAPISQNVAVSPAMIAALNNVAVSLSRVGNNVNQLALATHTGRDFQKYWHEIGQELDAELQAVRSVLQDALKGVRE